MADKKVTKKAAVKKKQPAKKTVKKAAVKKSPAKKKPEKVAKKATTKKTVKKAPAKKATTKKTVAKKSTKKTVAKKSSSPKAEKKVVVKKAAEHDIDKSFYAILKIKGEQIKLYKNEEVEVNRMEEKVGEKVEIKDVLLVKEGDKVTVGQPLVKGAVALLEITDQKKGKKNKTVFFRAKSRYRKNYGYRPYVTVVKFLGLK